MTNTVDFLITLDLLEKWNATYDRQAWFKSEFPQGAPYSIVQKALRNGIDDVGYATWLADRLFSVLQLANKKERMPVVDCSLDVNSTRASKEASCDAIIVDSREAALIANGGHCALVVSCGDFSQIASSGNCAQICSRGAFDHIGSSGEYARIHSNDYGVRIASSGASARIKASGRNAAVACVGYGSCARVAEGGAIVFAWHDRDNGRPRFTVGYAGEGIKADTWYSVNALGEFIEVDVRNMDDESALEVQ